MGRVKKYRKVKAMDPFAKGGGGGKMGRKSRSDDLDRNLPPDVKNHQAQRLNNLEGGATIRRTAVIYVWCGVRSRVQVVRCAVCRAVSCCVCHAV